MAEQQQQLANAEHLRQAELRRWQRLQESINRCFYKTEANIGGFFTILDFMLLRNRLVPDDENDWVQKYRALKELQSKAQKKVAKLKAAPTSRQGGLN